MQIIRKSLQIGSLTGVILTGLLVSSYPVAAQRACVMTDIGEIVCSQLQQNSQNSNVRKNPTENSGVPYRPQHKTSFCNVRISP